MEKDKIINLIVKRVSAKAIAEAYGLTVQAIIDFADNHRTEIATKIIDRMTKEEDQKDTVFDIKDKALNELSNNLKYAEIPDLLKTVEVLDRISQREKGFLPSEDDNPKEVRVKIEINNLLERRLSNAVVNNDGEIVAVGNRDMNPASINEVEKLYERHRKSKESERYLEGSAA